MIVKPLVFTDMEETEIAFNRATNEEIVRKILHNLNMLNELTKVAQVRAVATNIVGVSLPDPTTWQRCDGSEITDGTSPLRSSGGTDRFTPNVGTRYIRGANAGTTSGNELGGTASLNLEHNHSGLTGLVCFNTFGEEGDKEQVPFECHDHTISNDLSGAEPISPAFLQTDFYLKIN